MAKANQNLVFYRKYRPSTFAEVVGQHLIVETFQNAIARGKIGHAYLFTGPRGTGKTTLARLVAKTINCLEAVKDKNGRIEPCNKCEICTDINEGRSFDLVEIDAASNRGIDEIRELREGIKFSPIKSKYKVFIIDEAHQLTKEAFNALLKTLEEPPEHAVFIFATTEQEKMPATIVSRTQHFDFKRISLEGILHKLQGIAKSEGLEAEPEALRLMASSAEGSVRDAESLFNQVAVFASGKVSLEMVEEVLGAIRFEKLKELLEALAAKDAAQSVKFLNDAMESGYEIHEISRAVASNLRKILFLKLSPNLKEIFVRELGAEETEYLSGLAQKFDEKTLEKLLRSINSAHALIRRSVIPSLPLELAVVESLMEEEKVPKKP